MIDSNTPDLSGQELPPSQNLAELSSQRAEELENQYVEEQLPMGFFFKNNKLFYQPESQSDHSPAPSSIYICSKLSVTACTFDENNENHGRLLEFEDLDGHKKCWSMPMELLAGDGAEYRRYLLSQGLQIAPGTKARGLLTQYIQSSTPKRRVKCVGRTGWHHECYVLPDTSIGPRLDEELILQSTTQSSAHFAVKGGIKEWQENVSALCVGNSTLIFSVCAALAAPLLKLLDMESGGFHLRGESSTGKTTSLMVAASVWGGKNYIQRWRATANGIEAIAAAHNDALLCMDELSQLDPQEAGEIAYLLANGMGKMRADLKGFARKSSTWRLLVLSTGEISLGAHMMAVGKKIRGGQEVRIIDLPVTGYNHGAFEELHGFENGGAFAQALFQRCLDYHGSVGREFLKLVVQDRDEAIAKIKQYIKQFQEILPTGAVGQIFRVAQFFGLVAAAGELATCFRLTGWEQNQATDAIKRCFENWLNARGGLEGQEEQSILSQVRHFFQQYGESRFEDPDDNEKLKVNNRAGYKRKKYGKTDFFVFSEVFKADIAKGFDPRQVAKICVKAGVLMPGSNNEYTRSEKLPCLDQSTRFYRFNQSVLGLDVESVESVENETSD